MGSRPSAGLLELELNLIILSNVEPVDANSLAASPTRSGRPKCSERVKMKTKC